MNPGGPNLQSHASPHILDSDGGSQFSSFEFFEFLKDWAVIHRKSSAGNPQSNGRAELAFVQKKDPV